MTWSEWLLVWLALGMFTCLLSKIEDRGYSFVIVILLGPFVLFVGILLTVYDRMLERMGR